MTVTGSVVDCDMPVVYENLIGGCSPIMSSRSGRDGDLAREFVGDGAESAEM
ncbi:MAG: hypothetical protein QMB08_02845 [Acidimicrobiales bacterium]